VIALVVVVAGAALLVLGFVQARSVPTSEGAGNAAALMATGAVVLVGVAVFLLMRRGGGT
jgi:hypothetical protein